MGPLAMMQQYCSTFETLERLLAWWWWELKNSAQQRANWDRKSNTLGACAETFAGRARPPFNLTPGANVSILSLSNRLLNFTVEYETWGPWTRISTIRNGFLVSSRCQNFIPTLLGHVSCRSTARRRLRLTIQELWRYIPYIVTLAMRNAEILERSSIKTPSGFVSKILFCRLSNSLRPPSPAVVKLLVLASTSCWWSAN